MARLLIEDETWRSGPVSPVPFRRDCSAISHVALRMKLFKFQNAEKPVIRNGAPWVFPGPSKGRWDGLWSSPCGIIMG